MTNAALYLQPTYEVWLGTPTGERLALLDEFEKVSFARKLNNIGRWAVQIDAAQVPDQYVRKDAMIQIWRILPGEPGRLMMAGLTEIIDYNDRTGNDVLTLMGPDGMGILKRRIIAYDGDEAETSKSDYADDMMKAIIRENMGSLAPAARDLSALAFIVDSDHSLGPTVTRKFPRETLFKALKGIAKNAEAAGTSVYFDMVPYVVSNLQISWEFRTYIDRLGADRTYAGGNPTVFSREFGNLEGAKLTLDYSDMVSIAYVGGQGTGADREIATEENTNRADLSEWSRAESFRPATKADSDSVLADAAKEEIQAGAPKKTFTAVLKDTLQTRYGVDWDFGDRIVAVHRGLEYNGDIDALEITISRDGNERIAAQIDIEE